MNVKASLTDQKLRGGYYTPSDIAKAISEWAIQSNKQNILEPSFGDGVFLDAAISILQKQKTKKTKDIANIFGVELLTSEYDKAIDHILYSHNVHLQNTYNCDFFTWASSNKEKFDAVIGNPPFIRYQNFPEPSRSLALALSLKSGVKLTKLTNIWVPFVVICTGMLNENGKLGMVIPAELLQVSYAGPLRDFLIHSFKSIHIYTCNDLIFEEAEQEIVILLADGKQSNSLINGTVEVINSNKKGDLLDAIAHDHASICMNKSLDTKEKWTKYFLDQNEIELLRELRKSNIVSSFGDYYDVDVGVVTGNNSFFIINRETSEKYNLLEYIKPIIGRSYLLKEEILTKDIWNSYWDNGYSVGLLDLNSLKGELPANVLKYLNIGKKNDIHKGYKCSIRKDWYKVPSIWIPYAFMFRQIHDFPHLIINEAKALSTDTIHRVKQKNNNSIPQSIFYTYLTAASAEIEGRSYGGGVLELEPSEAERLLIPNPQKIDTSKLSSSVDRKENGKFLERNSIFILHELMGLSKKDIKLLASSYLKLFSRRKSRKKNTQS